MGKGISVITDVIYEGEDIYVKSFDKPPVHLASLLGDTPLIIEKVIKQTKQFELFNPTSVNTIRMITSRSPNGDVRLHIAQIKIGRKSAVISNAHQTEELEGGNIDGTINIETGIIERVYDFRSGRDYEIIENHPDTGIKLKGVKIENWDMIREKVLDFQRSLPHMNMPGWDIAITDSGPCVIEINSLWGLLFQVDETQLIKDQMQKLCDEWSAYNSKQENWGQVPF